MLLTVLGSTVLLQLFLFLEVLWQQEDITVGTITPSLMCDAERLITMDDRRNMYKTTPNQECFPISSKLLTLVMSETDFEQEFNCNGKSAKSIESIEDNGSIDQSVISDDIEFLLTMKGSETMKNHWKETHGLETENIELPSFINTLNVALLVYRLRSGIFYWDNHSKTLKILRAMTRKMTGSYNAKNVLTRLSEKVF
ncbi:unnamed protein product [Allacma fusca]|uniref:PiggyBac transposable element-derived protein domain-containing protein n=1 Tax=Allacma fusca TaxID=39272 RepID=A0A8J2LA22_9HEXA|nr:unnamed protein product [Allacma fusca]